MLRPTQPPNTHRSYAHIAPAREAKQHRKQHQPRRVPTRRQPDPETRHDGQDDHEKVDIEWPDLIPPVARQCTPKRARRVQNRQDLERERGTEPLGTRIRRDVRNGDEERKLQEENPHGREEEGPVPEDAEVRVGARVVRGRETAPDEEVGRAGEQQAQEGEDADGPAPAQLGEQRLEHQRENDAADGAARGCEAGGEAPPAHEEVAWGGEGRGEEEGAG